MNNSRRQEAGVNIRKARENAGVSIARLMDETGYQLLYIEAVESGEKEATLELLKKTAEVCGVPVGSLLTASGSDEMSAKEGKELEEELMNRWRGLTVGDKQEVGDLLKFILERKRAKDVELDRKYKINS